jgi:hypothetical protein
MTTRFKHGTGNWTDYRRQFPGIREVDFHFGSGRDSEVPYWERMATVRHTAHAALVEAQAAGCEWVMFTHGASTSRRLALPQLPRALRSAASCAAPPRLLISSAPNASSTKQYSSHASRHAQR